jgi:hypothetical protein
VPRIFPLDPNTIQHQIGNVIDPTFVSVPIQTSGGTPSEPRKGFLEIYGGTVSLDPDGNYDQAKGLSDNSIGYSFCRVIVPMGIRRGPPGDSSADRMVVRSYGIDDNKPDFLQFTVSVGLAGTNPLGGQSAWESVERADLVLQPQFFDDDGVVHQVLVLGFQTYYHNTHLLRVAYNISISGVDIGATGGNPPAINNPPGILLDIRPDPGPTP